MVTWNDRQPALFLPSSPARAPASPSPDAAMPFSRYLQSNERDNHNNDDDLDHHAFSTQVHFQLPNLFHAPAVPPGGGAEALPAGLCPPSASLSWFNAQEGYHSLCVTSFLPRVPSPHPSSAPSHLPTMLSPPPPPPPRTTPHLLLLPSPLSPPSIPVTTLGLLPSSPSCPSPCPPLWASQYTPLRALISSLSSPASQLVPTPRFTLAP